jgi:hypothetical protein
MLQETQMRKEDVRFVVEVLKPYAVIGIVFLARINHLHQDKIL